MALQNLNKLILSIIATVVTITAWSPVLVGSFVPKWDRPPNSTQLSNSSYIVWGREDCNDVICRTSIRQVRREVIDEFERNGEWLTQRNIDVSYTPVTKCMPADFCNTTWFENGGSSIKIDVNHHYSDEDSFNIRCSLVKDQNCAKTSIIILLFKDNVKKIASVQGDNNIDYGRLQKQSVRAVGFIDHDDVSNSYLSVTIDHVMKEDPGLYTCSLVYLDCNETFHYEKTSENITFENLNNITPRMSLCIPLIVLEAFACLYHGN